MWRPSRNRASHWAATIRRCQVRLLGPGRRAAPAVEHLASQVALHEVCGRVIRRCNDYATCTRLLERCRFAIEARDLLEIVRRMERLSPFPSPVGLVITWGVGAPSASRALSRCPTRAADEVESRGRPASCGSSAGDGSAVGLCFSLKRVGKARLADRHATTLGGCCESEAPFWWETRWDVPSALNSPIDTRTGSSEW